MNIIVCIKPVRYELVDINNNVLDLTINPYDLKALQQILFLKEKIKCNIICISMGSRESEKMLQRCLAMGADRIILLNDNKFAGSDTYATSYILSKAIEKIEEYSLIVTGEKSIDGETGQVSCGLAKRLNINCIDGVEEILEIDEYNIVLNNISTGYINIIKTKFPILITLKGFTTKENELGLLSLKRAYKKNAEIWGAEHIHVDLEFCGQKGSKTKVVEIKDDFIKKSTMRIEGDIQKKASILNNLILNRGIDFNE